MTNAETCTSVDKHLTEAVRDRLQNIGKQQCEEWGGVWEDGSAHVREVGLEEDYRSKTVVDSPESALAAFEKYTEWFENVLKTHKRQSESAVILPCGANKPIGTSAIHSKKVDCLKETEPFNSMDIVIMSEPCTVIPHSQRLALPAVNYEFPPKWTTDSEAPEVFDLFVERLSEWIDESGYSALYPYLIKRHQEKFEAALEKSSRSPSVCEIPGSSINRKNMNRSGDRFKTHEDIKLKLKAVYTLKVEERSHHPDVPENVMERYRDILSV